MPFSRPVDQLFDQFKDETKKTPAALEIMNRLVTPQSGGDTFNTSKSVTNMVTVDFGGYPYKPIITKFIKIGLDKKPVAEVTRANFSNFYAFVQNYSFTHSSYRNVKLHEVWRDLYQVKNCEFYTFNSKTGEKGTKRVEASYCQKCQLVLPLTALQIDHQKPQSGGDDQAMFRVFRALGLTVESGGGFKNRGAQGSFAQGVGGNGVPQQGAKSADPGKRYTLTAVGDIYYTVLHHYKLLEEMREMSMHHIVNLRPMCSHCNPSQGNTGGMTIFR